MQQRIPRVLIHTICFHKSTKRNSTTHAPCQTLKYKYQSSLPKSFYRLKEYGEAIRSLEDPKKPKAKSYDRLTDLMGHVSSERHFFDALCDAIKSFSYPQIFHYLNVAEKEGIQPLPYAVLTALDELFTELFKIFDQHDSIATSFPHATKVIFPVWVSVMRLQLGAKFLDSLRSLHNDIRKPVPDSDAPSQKHSHIFTPFSFPLDFPVLPLIWFHDDGHKLSAYSTDCPALANLPRPSMLFRLSVSALHAVSALGDVDGISLIGSAILQATVDCSSCGDGTKVTAKDVAYVWDDVLTSVIQGFRRCSKENFLRFSHCAERIDIEAKPNEFLFFPPLSLEKETLGDVITYFPNASANYLEGLSAHGASEDTAGLLKAFLAKIEGKSTCTKVAGESLDLLRDLAIEQCALRSDFTTKEDTLRCFLREPSPDFKLFLDRLLADTSVDPYFAAFLKKESAETNQSENLDRPLSWIFERSIESHGMHSVFCMLEELLDEKGETPNNSFLWQRSSEFPLSWETLLSAIVKSDDVAIDTKRQTYCHVLEGYMSRILEQENGERKHIQRVMSDAHLPRATLEALVKMNMVEQGATFVDLTLPLSNLHISAHTFIDLFRKARDQGMYKVCALLSEKRALIIPSESQK